MVKSKDKTNTNKTAICKHISRVMGNDHRSSNIILEIQRWRDLSGVQWTNDRLKTLKQDVLQFIANESFRIKGIFPISPDSYIKHNKKGWPSGPLGNFIKSSLMEGGVKKLGILMSVLEVTRTFKFKVLSDKQVKKFTEAIQGEPIRPDLFNYSHKLGRQCVNHFSEEMSKKFGKMYLKNHRFNFAGLNSAKPLTSFTVPGLKKKSHPWLLSLIESTVVDGPWTSILKTMGLPSLPNSPKRVYAGRIKVIQEGGLKARVIAMPTAGIQVAFKPLHDTLGQILKALPEDCTYNQESGVEWGSEMIRQGKSLYAVDLSSATDNFPLGFQISILEFLKYPYTQEFLETCRLGWGFQEKGSDLTGPFTYTKGQPMGLYGSFALFALSHHFVLKGLEHKHKVKNTYRILGDDIIINNDKIHKDYMSFMASVGVPISVRKCMSSDLYTEFAGKLIGANGRIPIAKGPKNDNKAGLLDVNQFKNYCEVTGSLKSSISAVPKRYKNYAENLLALPHSFGGLGFNPKGLSLEDRLVRFEDSKLSAYPIQADLSSRLIETSLNSDHPHVDEICFFISEQLMSIRSDIRKELEKRGYYNLPDQLLRPMLAQVLESERIDNTLSFKAVIKELPDDICKQSVYTQWKTSSQSTSKTVERRFDEIENPHEFFSSGNVSETLSKSNPITPSWM